MYGDGSNGALNVTTGTTNLLLDTKYQYTTVNVSAGATISTSSTTGSVLYILATTSIVIDGNISLSNKVAAGQNSWSFTVDGVTYTSPSTASGGGGGGGASQGNGFGGGGKGNGNIYASGGLGGTGGSTPGIGGAASSGTYTQAGKNGGTSAGGSGAVDTGSTAQTSGKGGDAYGSNGSNGGGSSTGGGGGAGGQAGRPGVHIVLKAPTITINGFIVSSATDGLSAGNGGTGGLGAGAGGGGGGGGNAGNVYLSAGSITDTYAGYVVTSGAAGSGGSGSAAGSSGSPGTAGQLFKYISVPAPDIQGPFVKVWNGTAWVYSKVSVKDATAFKQTKIKVQ